MYNYEKASYEVLIGDFHVRLLDVMFTSKRIPYFLEYSY